MNKRINTYTIWASIIICVQLPLGAFAQNVGVGILAPLGKLHIKGSANVSQLIIDANSTQGNTSPIIKLRSSSGSELMWIHSDHPQNVFLGVNAGRVNNAAAGGVFNTFIGAASGYLNTIGMHNTANGNEALFSNTTGEFNTAIGSSALRANNSGSENTANGVEALRWNSTGSFNTANGSGALHFNTEGDSNTAIGHYALRNNKAGSGATAIGYYAMYNANNSTTPFSNYNVAVGYEALMGSTSAENNTGNYNTALGNKTLTNNISGNDNTATGSLALFVNTIGNQNNAYGRNALFSNTSAGRNVAIGNSALYAQSYDPGNAWLSNNVAVGYNALNANQPTSVTNGINNTAIGNNALTTNITGANNTTIGYNADVSSNNLTNATAIGYNAKVAASNALVLGGTGTDAVNVGIGTTTPDAKLHVNGPLKVVDGTQGAGKILTSDATGMASWQPPPPPPPPPAYYPTVWICCNPWMTKNLDVSTYRNGDVIPEVQDAAAWAALTTGAWCYYGNNTANGPIYGKLYNWYAVNDPRGLAPEGWHIPSDFEWVTLGNCLGGYAVAGGPMKEIGTTHWNTPNSGATNLSNFTGLPGGFRDNSGPFSDIGINGSWWSSSEDSTLDAWYRLLLYSTDDLYRYSGPKRFGFSVRCLRD